MTDAASNHTTLSGVPSGVGIAQGAKSSGLLSVAVAGQIVTMQADRDTAFAAGDQVAFVRVGAVYAAVARLRTAASIINIEAAVPPLAKPATVRGTKTFTPLETITRLGAGWRTDGDQIYQGQYGSTSNNVGCAFYGRAPRSLSGAVVTAASIRVRRASSGGITASQPTTLWLVTEQSRPPGAPTLTSSATGPQLAWNGSKVFAVPTAWGQAMVDGTAGGIAVYDPTGAPYVILDGHGRYAPSFALTLAWRR